MSVGPVRRRFIEWSNSRRFVLWFLGFWVVVCVAAAAISYADAKTLQDHGVKTQAVVTAVHDGRDAYVTLSFTTRDDESVTADVGDYDWSPHPRVGDTPTVIYDPDDPSGLVADARLGPDFFATWLFVAGAVVALLVWVLTWTGKVDWLAIARRRYGLE